MGGEFPNGALLKHRVPEERKRFGKPATVVRRCNARLPGGRMSTERYDTVEAVYELRAAAVAHGKAIAEAERCEASDVRDRLLATTLTLESKTAAVLDECSENAEEAASEASGRA
jgi:hypothetical protein